jgi:hypothetical protein
LLLAFTRLNSGGSIRKAEFCMLAIEVNSYEVLFVRLDRWSREVRA